MFGAVYGYLSYSGVLLVVIKVAHKTDVCVGISLDFPPRVKCMDYIM